MSAQQSSLSSDSTLPLSTQSSSSSGSAPPSPTTTSKELKSRMKNSYDAIAHTYNAWTTRHSASQNSRLTYLEKLLPHLTTNHHHRVSVLELGCGAGIPGTAKLLSYPNISVTANDLSSTQISLAKKNLENQRGHRVSFIESDMMSLNLPIQAFDAVVAFYSICHLPRQEQVTMIHRVAKWLKPGGFLLANFTAESSEGQENEHWLGEEKGWVFWSGWGAEGTTEMIENEGLEILEKDITQDVNDGHFLWVLAKRPVKGEDEQHHF